MPFMGYDRDRLEVLRSAMRRAVDEIDGRRCDDVAAGDAARVAATIRRSLADHWLQLLDGLLGCVAFEQRTPAHLDDGDLRNAWLLAVQAAGWQVVTDPEAGWFADPTGRVPTEHEVRALAEALAHGELGDLLDTPSELIWLTSTMHSVVADPVLSAAFRDILGGDERWAYVFDHLGGDRGRAAQRMLDDPDDPNDTDLAGHVRRFDDAIAALTAVYAAGPHGGRGAWYPSVTHCTEPYTAALILDNLGATLAASVLAAVAHDVVERWYDPSSPTAPWRDQHWGGDNTADLVFRVLAQRPSAATSFLLLAADRPELVFLTAEHDDVVNALIVAGTDPASTDPAEAGRIVTNMIGYLRDPGWQVSPTRDGVTLNAHAIMGSVIAPWLLQFGSRSDDWAWTPDDGDSALRWVISDAAAMARLGEARGQWQHQIAEASLIGRDGRIDEHALHELADMCAQLELALRDQEIDDAASARLFADVAFFIGELVVPMAFQTTTGGVVADVAVAAISPVVRAWMEDQGWIPPNEAEARDQAQTRFGSRLIDTGVIAVVGAVGQLVERGVLPAAVLDRLELDLGPESGDVDGHGDGHGGCTAEEAARRLRAFVTDLELELDPLTYESLLLVADVFAGPVVGRIACG